MSGTPPLPTAAVLRDLLARARAARTDADIEAVLSDVAEHAAQQASMGFAMIDLHRPQWDDFETVAIAGPEHVRDALLNTTTQWPFWTSKLGAEFTRGGVQHIGPGDEPGVRMAGPWQPGEVLFCVLKRTGGDIIGMLRAGAPLDGGRPTEDQLEALALCAEFATTAVEAVENGRDAAGSRAALDGLAEIASRPVTVAQSTSSVEDLCRQVQAGLGFSRVAALVADGTGLLRPVASVGCEDGTPLFDHPWLSLAQLGRLFAGPYLRHGCSLIERDDLISLLDLRGPVPRGARNGDGPYAWRDHWLFAPLVGADGRGIGVLWADQPVDRLIPDRERLTALRAFAGQASASIALNSQEPADDRDPLTGLPSRATLADRLRHALRREQRTTAGVSVIFLDIDHFSTVNRDHGPGIGDQVLQRIAARIDDALRPTDTVARFGGDGFVIVCEDVGGPEQALEVADRLRAGLAAPMELDGREVAVTASLGVAVAAQVGLEADSLLQAADRAMYEAKADGRDTARLASPGAGWP